MKELQDTDIEIYNLIRKEEQRQAEKIRLIASENYVSKSVLQATGSVLTNKYSEGYPEKRYYEGQQVIDQIEKLTIKRIKKIFGAEHVNVQPYSGSPANLAVYLAFLKPGDAILGMALPHGGHLTHGAKVSISGKYFNASSYTIDPETGMLDYEAIHDMAQAQRPKIIIAGHSAYPGIPDFAKFREIADAVNAILMVDMSHFAGLVAGGVHPSPVPHADVVTSTTHKSLRGPRGAMILCKEKYAAVIDKAVFPGIQGGPHNHTTAAIAVTMEEASSADFRHYAAQVVKNAKTLADALLAQGFKLVTHGTSNHLLLIDLTNKNVTGKQAATAFDKAGIVTNCNTVPFDPRTPFDPSGLRIGTCAVTSRGFAEQEMQWIGEKFDQIIAKRDNDEELREIARKVRKLCRKFPAPGLEHLF